MFDHHRAEITVMQFTGHPLPVNQFETAPWDFKLVPYCQPSSPTQSLPITGQRNMQCPPSLEWHVWPGRRSIYNNHLHYQQVLPYVKYMTTHCFFIYEKFISDRNISYSRHPKHERKIEWNITQSAGAVEYTDCFSKRSDGEASVMLELCSYAKLNRLKLEGFDI